MKRILIMVFYTSMGVTLFAQKTVDAVSFQYRYGLPQSYEDTYTEKAIETGTITGITAGKNVTENSMIGFNLNHFYFNVQGDPDIPDGIVNPIKLNGIILRAGLVQSLSKDRTLQIMAAPRVMSDFKNLDGHSFQMGGVVTLDRKYRDELKVGFGIMYNQELFGPYLVPLVNLYWEVSSKWTISGMIPITSKFNYQVNENMSLGFGHFGMSTSFYLGDEAYAGDYIDRLSVDASAFLRHRLFGPLFIEALFGRTFARSYKQYGGDEKVDLAIPLVTFGDNRTVKSVKFDDGIIAQLKLVINVTRPE